jgi:hypothetical protein
MIKHDIGVCSHVPFRVLFYEGSDGKARIAYDLPSPLMSGLNNEAVENAARPIDEKVIAFFTDLAGVAP